MNFHGLGLVCVVSTMLIAIFSSYLCDFMCIDVYFRCLHISLQAIVWLQIYPRVLIMSLYQKVNSHLAC